MLPFLIPLAGWGAAGLGVAAGGTALVGAFPGAKEDLNLGEESRAKEEVRQGRNNRHKGYDPREGIVNRSLIEIAKDGLLGNDPDKILEKAQTAYKDDLEYDFGDRLAKVDRRLTELDQPSSGIQFTARSDRKAIERELTRLEGKLPKLESAYTVNPDGGYTIDSSGAELARGTRKGIEKETNDAYRASPQYQQYLDQLEASDRRFNATQQLAIGQLAMGQQNQANQMAIAQMNNQLQMRREDRREARLEKQDRQQMIAMLMKGLTGLGQSFAL